MTNFEKLKALDVEGLARFLENSIAAAKSYEQPYDIERRVNWLNLRSEDFEGGKYEC